MPGSPGQEDLPAAAGAFRQSTATAGQPPSRSFYGRCCGPCRGGAIQIAGTAQPAQLPFFVAACDYTLIGEEFFAASAYLSGSSEEIGSLKGQDVGKVVVALGLVVGILLTTIAGLTGSANIEAIADFIRDTVMT